MSGNAKSNVGYAADIVISIVRAMLAAFLLVHAVGQLRAFWQASQIINPGAFPDPVMLANIVVPTVIFIGAIMLTLGFKTRFTALTLMLLLACASVIDLLLVGAAGSALDWLSRLTVTLGLLVPFVTGGGRLSVDGLMEEPSPAPRTAQ